MKKLLSENNLNPEERAAKRLSNLIRDGVKLGYSLTGQNLTDLDTKTMKVMSPRFLSLIPEEENNVCYKNRFFKNNSFYLLEYILTKNLFNCFKNF